MRIMISVLVFSVLLAGCVNGKFHRKSITGGACPGTVDGYTYTLVTYGNGKIIVIPLSNIRANSEWRFYLYPLDNLGGRTAYGNSTVTIDGKAAGGNVLLTGAPSLAPYVLPSPPLDDNWLSAAGTFNTATGTGSKRYITACVHPDVQENQEWQFLVNIDDVGQVDPRGKVE
jgi:hypothetical protein